MACTNLGQLMYWVKNILDFSGWLSRQADLSLRTWNPPVCRQAAQRHELTSMRISSFGDTLDRNQQPLHFSLQELFLQDDTLQMLMIIWFNSGGSHQTYIRNSDFNLVVFSARRHRENYDKLSVKCDIQINVAMKCVPLEFNQAYKPV